MRQNKIVTICLKQIFRQAIRRIEKKSEIMTISKKYKGTLNNLIDSSDIELLSKPEFSDWLELIDKRTRNVRRSRGTLSNFSKDNC